MDPQETLLQALRSLARLEKDPGDTQERHAAADALEALAEWLRKGGFPPSVSQALTELR